MAKEVCIRRLYPKLCSGCSLEYFFNILNSLPSVAVVEMTLKLSFRAKRSGVFRSFRAKRSGVEESKIRNKQFNES